jgi:predicted nucleotidyltransferase
MRIEEIIDETIEKCKAYDAESVILFGSRAKGTYTPRSDIDIAVSGVSDIESLRESLDSIPTLYTIDLVNLDTCKNNLLLEDIAEYGCQIYKKI